MRPDRLEVELFGAEAGAQGGDLHAKVGTFEQAHGGTLLLDEVADMPLETQGKIVRVLQEQTFERVGGRARVEVDVRVVASSNRDLAAEIAAGRFREDLFYRLNVVPIRVPALRERREDIPELARHFMSRAAGAAGMVAREIGEDAMAALQAYDWPGNVRQLRNVIEWLLIMTPGDPAVPIRVRHAAARSRAPSCRPASRARRAPRSWRCRCARRASCSNVSICWPRSRGSAATSPAPPTFVGMERSALHRKLKSLGVHGVERSSMLDS